MTENVKIYPVTSGRRVGMWTFSIDGKPSLFYAPTKESIERKLARLVDPKIGTVTLPALNVMATTMSAGALQKELIRRSSESTLEGFMRRGKLANA